MRRPIIQFMISHIRPRAGLAALLIALAASWMVSPTTSAQDRGNPGAIWTTNSDCGAEQQNVNHYAHGETVYVSGRNFNPGSYAWTITGLPGNASEDPDLIVASGTIAVPATGSFCFAAYTVASDDGGEYKVTVGNKHDNYHVDRPAVGEPPVPPTPAEPTPTPPAGGSEQPVPTATSGVEGGEGGAQPTMTSVVDAAQPTATAVLNEGAMAPTATAVVLPESDERAPSGRQPDAGGSPQPRTGGRDGTAPTSVVLPESGIRTAELMPEHMPVTAEATVSAGRAWMLGLVCGALALLGLGLLLHGRLLGRRGQ